MRFLLMPALSLFVLSCEFFEGRELFPEPTEQGIDSGFEFRRLSGNVPPTAELWIGIGKTETRTPDFNSCSESPLSPSCGSGGSTIVPLVITDASFSTHPHVAEVLELYNDIESTPRSNRVRIRALTTGGARLTVGGRQDDETNRVLSGSHTVLVRDFADAVVVAHCGDEDYRLLIPGSEGPGGAMTTFPEVVLLEEVVLDLTAIAVGVESDGSIMAGVMPVESDPPGLLDGEPVGPGEFAVSFPGTGAEIPITVIMPAEIDGFRFVAVTAEPLGTPLDYAWVPATTVPLKGADIWTPPGAHSRTTVLPLRYSGSRVVCASEYLLPEGTPPPTMTSKTPEVCEIEFVAESGRGVVEHVSVGLCEVTVDVDGVLETLEWMIE